MSGFNIIEPPDIPNPTIPVLDRPFSIESPLIIERPLADTISLIASSGGATDWLHPSRPIAAVPSPHFPNPERFISTLFSAPQSNNDAVRSNEPSNY